MKLSKSPLDILPNFRCRRMDKLTVRWEGWFVRRSEGAGEKKVNLGWGGWFKGRSAGAGE